MAPISSDTITAEDSSTREPAAMWYSISAASLSPTTSRTISRMNIMPVVETASVKVASEVRRNSGEALKHST